MVSTIEWYKKEADEIYEHFNSLEKKDAFLLLTNLLKDHPEVPIAWMDLLGDIEDHLIEEGMVDEVIEFIDLYRLKFPGIYEHEYGYIEMELIPHLFYKGDIDAIKKRVELIKSNPVTGCDFITVGLLFRLIFHGHYDLALEYSRTVWKPLYEDEDLIKDPASEFRISIYLNELENWYNKLKEGEIINASQLKQDMEVYGFDEDLEIFEDVVDKLSSPGYKDGLKHESFRNTRDLLLFLDIQFIKFMKDEYNIPFILSSRFFNMLHKPELFGQADSDKGFFYIPYPILSEHYDRMRDRYFNINDAEIFGKVFGLKYVYHFLHVHNYIDDNFHKLMNENIHFLEYEFMINYRPSLWEMMFVFGWPELSVNDPDQVGIFKDSYCYYSDNIAEEKVNKYLRSFIIPERIQNEIDAHNDKEEESDSNYSFDDDEGFDFDDFNDFDFPAPVSPIVNQGPKIGRNDPCPCGSGKKYKKCCLQADPEL